MFAAEWRVPSRGIKIVRSSREQPEVAAGLPLSTWIVRLKIPPKAKSTLSYPGFPGGVYWIFPLLSSLIKSYIVSDYWGIMSNTSMCQMRSIFVWNLPTITSCCQNFRLYHLSLIVLHLKCISVQKTFIASKGSDVYNYIAPMTHLRVRV